MIFSERQFFTGRINLQYGATLLEMMLVLGIMGFIIVASLKAYQQFQNTLSLQQLQDNVDQLFEATAGFYKNFCIPTSATTGQQFTAPNGVPPNATTATPPGISPVGISSMISLGFLTNWHPSVPMVDPSAGESGYLVQLNPNSPPSSSIPVNVCVVGQPGATCLPITAANVLTPTKAFSAPPAAQIPASEAKVIQWTIQVAVHITPKSKIGGYGAVLGATCVSGLTGGAVDPCPSSNANRDWLVWTRTPSAISIKKGPLFSTFQPLLKEFMLQYTHDQNYELNSGYGATATPSAPVYYNCGG